METPHEIVEIVTGVGVSELSVQNPAQSFLVQYSNQSFQTQNSQNLVRLINESMTGDSVNIACESSIFNPTF